MELKYLITFFNNFLFEKYIQICIYSKLIIYNLIGIIYTIRQIVVSYNCKAINCKDMLISVMWY